MKKPVIGTDRIKKVYDGHFIRVFDMEYAPGRHYLDATRHDADGLVALKSDEEFKAMSADAVSCALELDIDGKEPLLCLMREYRYPTGQFILGVPAGLMDEADREASDPVMAAARREIHEETGIELQTGDTVKVVNPFIFSTPGMTDEANAFLYIRLRRSVMPEFSQDGAEGSEVFDGFEFLTREAALKVLCDGRDGHGIYYSVYTWMALMCFVTDVFK